MRPLLSVFISYLNTGHNEFCFKVEAFLPHSCLEKVFLLLISLMFCLCDLVGPFNVAERYQLINETGDIFQTISATHIKITTNYVRRVTVTPLITIWDMQ